MPARKVDLVLIRRKVYHKACGELLRWMPFPRGVMAIDEAMYQCTGCWKDESTGKGFWRYATLEKWEDPEFAARFEIDDEDTQ